MTSIMKYNFLEVRTFLFITLNIFIQYCASKECAVSPDYKCSGGGRWDSSTKSCNCRKHFWGEHCEFGRLR